MGTKGLVRLADGYPLDPTLTLSQFWQLGLSPTDQISGTEERLDMSLKLTGHLGFSFFLSFFISLKIHNSGPSTLLGHPKTVFSAV